MILYILYLKSYKSVSCRRFVKKTIFFTSNFFKKINVLNNVGLNKKLSLKYRKINKYNKKKNQKYKNKYLITVNLFRMLINRKYCIIFVKKKSNTNHTVGFIQLKDKLKSNVYLKKQILFNNSTFIKKFNKVSINSTYFYFNIFYGFRLQTHYYNLNTRFNMFNYSFFLIGSVINLCFMDFGHMCYNVINFKKNIKYSTAPGTFSVLLEHSSVDKTAMIQLPSGKLKIISYYDIAIIGRCANIFSKYRVLGKASNLFFWKKKKVKVRGVAMNPVDHPNGGRTKVKKPFKSVWGWVAKNNK